MARHGIQYSDVARAAARLIADGKNPTVDSVRHTLGGTGSKSTIAPFLKRWKTEQEDTAVAEVTLPAPLLNAVRGLHEHMQEEFLQQRQALEEKHLEALQTFELQAKQLASDKDTALAAHAEVADELERTRQTLNDLQERFHAHNVLMATMQAELVGMQQRLTDRAKEIGTLSDQLSQSREQFAHYQEATAAQREADRRNYEQRIARHEQELIMANREMAGLQATLSQRDSALSSLNLAHASLQNEAGSLRYELQTVQSAKDRLAEQLMDTSRARDDAYAQVKHVEQALLESRLAAASQERETQVRTDQLRHANAQIDLLGKEKLSWVQQRTILEQQLQVAKQEILSHSEARPNK